MFIPTTRKIWMQLEQRFSVVNGSRKYRLNKQLYELKQNGVNINEYYTTMKIIWEEVENLRDLPAITSLTPEEEGDALAMYGKGWVEGCTICGKRNHTTNKCCKVVRFPKDHPKNKRPHKGRWKENTLSGKWNSGKGVGRTSTNSSQGESRSISLQQLEQMIKIMAGISSQPSECEEEGTARVGKDLDLKEVLYVPESQHSLLLKLESTSKSLRLINVGEEHDGIYYLMEKSMEEAISKLKQRSPKKKVKMKAVANLGHTRIEVRKELNKLSARMI
ncbi:Carbamoyl-phosphate synthase large chain [Bienertia sinuspersici]